MAKKKTKKIGGDSRRSATITVRGSDRTVDALDRYVETLKAENPGGRWTRSSAALNLIELQLRELGHLEAR